MRSRCNLFQYSIGLSEAVGPGTPCIMPIRSCSLTGRASSFYYCGANDVNNGESAEAIAGRFGQFVARVASALPETRVFYVSINRAPQKTRQLWNVVDAANALVRAYAVVAPNVYYIDVNPALFDSLGTPRMEMYTEDGLHLTPAAYVEYTRIIKPVIAAAWDQVH